MEFVLLAGWTRPLGMWRHAVNPPDGAPMVTLLGRTREGAFGWAIPAALLTALWFAALFVAPRIRGRATLAIGLVAPALFMSTLLPAFPGGTQDVFHNVADARTLWLHRDNPTLVPPEAHTDDRFLPNVFGYRDLPSAYGPLWYALAGIPVAVAGDGLVPNVVGQKALVSVFWMATVALVALSSRAVGRDDATPVVLVGWCPLFLWEFAGNGHNDAAMVFFGACAGVALLRGRYVWVFPALALAVLVKFTLLLVGPVLLVWMLRRQEIPRRVTAGSLALAALIVIAAYVPFWAGRQTLTFLHRPGMTFILSPATLLHTALTGWLSESNASRIAYALTGLAFVAVFGLVVWRARGGPDQAIGSVYDALFAYLVFASWWFWPWYLAWLAPFAAWSGGWRRAGSYAVVTATALFTYLYWWVDPVEGTRRWYELYMLISGLVFAPAALLWAGFAPLRRRGRAGGVRGP